VEAFWGAADEDEVGVSGGAHHLGRCAKEGLIKIRREPAGGRPAQPASETGVADVPAEGDARVPHRIGSRCCRDCGA
jgi:hypothetical protein